MDEELKARLEQAPGAWKALETPAELLVALRELMKHRPTNGPAVSYNDLLKPRLPLPNTSGGTAIPLAGALA